MGTDYKGITATHKELTEAGYFHTAKLIILRNLYLQNKTSPAPSKKSHMTFCTHEKSKPKNKSSAKTNIPVVPRPRVANEYIDSYAMFAQVIDGERSLSHIQRNRFHFNVIYTFHTTVEALFHMVTKTTQNIIHGG